jgi:DnaJ-class molecular chaperone
MAKDYYDVLGVSKKATSAEIKKSYRGLAREHHPDMVKDSDKTTAEKRFKEINEAYQVLSDPQKRQMYDQFGHTGPGFNGAPGQGAQGASGNWGPFSYSYNSAGQGQSPFGGAEGFDPFEVFESIFGSRGFGGARTPKKGKNLHYELHIDFKEAVFGLEKEVNIDSGKVKIKIPGGVRNGSEIKFAGKGMPAKDLPNGDLFITIRYRSPREFEIVRSDIVITKEIDFATATLGDAIEISVVDLENPSGIGKTKIKIPAGTQPRTNVLVKGKGMPGIQGGPQGNALVQLRVVIPKRLNRKQKKLLEEYKKL